MEKPPEGDTPVMKIGAALLHGTVEGSWLVDRGLPEAHIGMGYEGGKWKCLHR